MKSSDIVTLTIISSPSGECCVGIDEKLSNIITDDMPEDTTVVHIPITRGRLQNSIDWIRDELRRTSDTYPASYTPMLRDVLKDHNIKIKDFFAAVNDRYPCNYYTLSIACSSRSPDGRPIWKAIYEVLNEWGIDF